MISLGTLSDGPSRVRAGRNPEAASQRSPTRVRHERTVSPGPVPGATATPRQPRDDLVKGNPGPNDWRVIPRSEAKLHKRESMAVAQTAKRKGLRSLRDQAPANW